MICSETCNNTVHNRGWETPK